MLRHVTPRSRGSTATGTAARTAPSTNPPPSPFETGSGRRQPIERGPGRRAVTGGPRHSPKVCRPSRTGEDTDG